MNGESIGLRCLQGFAALAVTLGAVAAVPAAARAESTSAPVRQAGIEAVAKKDWRFCEARIYRKGRPYGRVLVRKIGKGKNATYRQLRGRLEYTRNTKAAVYRIDGRCASTRAALQPPRQVHHQIPVVPRGGASTGMGGGQAVDVRILGGGAAALAAGLLLVLAGTGRRTRSDG